MFTEDPEMPPMPYSMRHRLIDDEFTGLSSRPGKCGGAVFRASCKWGKNVRLRNPYGVCSVRSGTEAAAETTLFNVYCWGDYRAVHAFGSSGQRVRGGPGCPGHLAGPHRPLRPHHGTPLLGMAARTTESRGRR